MSTEETPKRDGACVLQQDHEDLLCISDIFTTGVNLAGLPALTMPGGFVGGLPVGLQLIGPYFSEARLLQVADAFQQRTDWHLKQPSMAI